MEIEHIYWSKHKNTKSIAYIDIDLEKALKYIFVSVINSEFAPKQIEADCNKDVN